MSFDVGTSEILTLIGLIIGAIFTYAGVKATVAGNRDAARPADWQAFTQELRTYFKEQLEERDERIDRLEKERADRDERIARLEDRDAERTGYIAYVTNWVRDVQEWAMQGGHKLPSFLSFARWQDQQEKARRP